MSGVKEENNLNLLDALDFIDPAALSYTDWVRVGMGLKRAGYPVSAWDDWSRRDSPNRRKNLSMKVEMKSQQTPSTARVNRMWPTR